MTINSFSAQNFRNYSELNLQPSPTLNIFFGQNASGKTSLLEALYYLGLGRSFRTRLLDRIIQYDTSAFTLFATVNQGEESSVPIGLERTREGGRRLHVAGQVQMSQSAAVKYLPLLFISTNSYRYFYDGPKARRNFLDWGVFHVKHQFLDLWQRLQRVLKQRNAALRQGVNKAQLQVWDHEFVEVAEQIHQLRQDYLAQLLPILDGLLAEFYPLNPLALSLRYERGWSKDKNLAQVLAENCPQDLKLGYTQAGPQRADLRVYVNSLPAQDVLSQGQQKQVAYGLHLAQGILFKQINQSSPIYLIDDLPAELDSEKRRCMANILYDLKAQVFVTGISHHSLIDMFPADACKMFHVKHGSVCMV